MKNTKVAKNTSLPDIGSINGWVYDQNLGEYVFYIKLANDGYMLSLNNEVYHNINYDRIHDDYLVFPTFWHYDIESLDEKASRAE